MAGLLTCGSSWSRTFPDEWVQWSFRGTRRLQLRGQLRHRALTRTAFPFQPTLEGRGTITHKLSRSLASVQSAKQAFRAEVIQNVCPNTCWRRQESLALRFPRFIWRFLLRRLGIGGIEAKLYARLLLIKPGRRGGTYLLAKVGATRMFRRMKDFTPRVCPVATVMRSISSRTGPGIPFSRFGLHHLAASATE